MTKDRPPYRLSQSRHREQFVLKGAMLFQFWSGQPHRPTRDLDLLGHGDPAPPSAHRGRGQPGREDGPVRDRD